MASKRKQFSGNSPKYKHRRIIETRRENRFQELSDLDDDDDQAGTEIFPTKVPPIVIDTSHSFTDVIKLLGQNAKYKRMSVGTKVMANSLNDYSEMISKLKSNNIVFYTHPVRDQKKFKLILFGLPQITINTITDELKTCFNITPVSVTEIVTQKSNKNDAIYSVEFDRGQISKREVRTKVKYLFNVVIQWRNPLRRTKGPTQCTKCAMYGHGASNCFRKSTCLICGGLHDSSTCQLNKTSSEGPVVYKCFNCIKSNRRNVNHRADNPKCPSRQEYLDIRQRITERNGPRISRNRNVEYSYSVEDFPQEVGNHTQPPNRIWPNQQPGNQQRFNQNQGQYHDNDDLPNDKILEIYFEAIDALQKCKNKFDKMRVLGNMLKYVI